MRLHPVPLAASSLLGVVVAGALAPFSPVAVAGQPDVLTAVVSYDDLNVATRRGAQELYRRINAAAYKVCWPLDHGDIRGARELNACLRNAVSNAVAKLNIPAVAAIHERQESHRE